jgi:predicted alpha/beta hydrolase
MMTTANPSARRDGPATLVAADGYRLGARRYEAIGPLWAKLIVAGATGVPQHFYRRFAEYASTRGFDTLTLDYRGVGLSRPDSLRGFEMNFLDWATLDLAAAVAAMSGQGLPLFMVGHSFGGHAFGLLPNHDRVDRLYTFGTGAGWHGWMPPLEQLRVLAMWRVVGPAIVRWKGYLAWSRLGLGEDLPLGVYRQWRRWCRFPRYFLDDPEMAQYAESFASVTTPIIAANSLDDRWASPRSRDAFMAGYRNADWQAVDLDPAREGLRGIGHMGYFRAPAQPLWERALDWFAAPAATPAR